MWSSKIKIRNRNTLKFIAKNPRKDGFTLVELVITIAILGILVGIGVPAYVGFLPKYRVDAAVKALAAEVNLARTTAIAANKVHHMVFDIANNQIILYQDDDNNWSTSNTIVKTVEMATDFPNVSLGYNPGALDLAGSALAQPATFGSSSSPVKATFYPNGLMAESGEFYLIPTSQIGVSNDLMRAVEVAKAGQATLYRYSASASPPWSEL